MARPRTHKQGIPNLYCKLDKRTGKTYWQYRHPISGTFIGFGTDAEAARAAALELNKLTAEQQVAQAYKLIDLVLEKKTSRKAAMRVNEWLDRYMQIQEERLSLGELKPNTLKVRRQCISTLSTRFGDQRIDEVETRQLAAVVDEYKSQGKASMASSLRSNWIDVFKEAQHAGEVPPGYNPALATRKPIARVTRQRLTLDVWKAIYDAAADMSPWVQNVMLLAMVTTQRRGDLARMRFKDVWDGHLHIEQEKTGMRLAIPLSLRLEGVGTTLEDVISRCRDRVVSPYLIHHTVRNSQTVLGEPVGVTGITQAFRAAIKKAGIIPAHGKELPTFHEQRSLAERLYREQGIDTKMLLGHRSQKTTDMYHDTRGEGWQTLVI